MLTPDRAQWPGGGGEMAALVRAKNWAETSLGPVDGWPQSLRIAVRLILTTQQPMFIWWGGDLIQFYNDAYRATMGPEKHPAALGGKGRDWWPEAWPIIGPQIDQVMSGQGATWHDLQAVPIRRFGSEQEVLWTYGFSPIDDPTAPNGIGGVLVVCTDVTEQRRTNAALRASEERWRGIFDRMHEGFATCEIIYDDAGTAIDFRHLDVNPAWARLTGMVPAQVVGRVASKAIPGLEPFWLDTYAQVVATGVAKQVEYRAAPLDRWFDVHAYPLDGARFAVLFLNITDRKANEERFRILVAELQHRVRNTLAVVRSITGRTAATSETVEQMAMHLQGRLDAFARVQSAITRGQDAAINLADMLHDELFAHVAHEGDNLALSGPEILLAGKPAEIISLAIHELATNAVKYGALGTRNGHVAINWRLQTIDDRPWLFLSWRESRLDTPTALAGTYGFGFELLEYGLPYELDAVTTIDLRPEGLTFTLSMPL